MSAVYFTQWDELYSDKPDDHYEDPADLAAIKSAQDNMGDYKLKSADDYVVPDNLRMNTDKARAKLLILKDLVGFVHEQLLCEHVELLSMLVSAYVWAFTIVLCWQIHQHKYDFNQRLLALRDKKLHLIGQISDLVTQLQEVQGHLGEEHQRPVPEVPQMHPEEMPEK